MASINNKASNVNVSKELSVYEKLCRSVMCNLLWEDEFYEDGKSNTMRIREYMKSVTKEEALSVLNESKFSNKLRHVPLFLIVQMVKRGIITSDEISNIITRVDDMSELISLYKNEEGNKATMIPHCITKGIAKAFPKFDEYQLAKYKGDKKAISLKDVIKVARPKPINKEQEELWKKVVENKLSTPDTWEVELSKSKDKKESWTRLLKEKNSKGYSKIGSLALLRNIRNIIESGVDIDILKDAINNMDISHILPYQFITANRYGKSVSKELEEKFFSCTKEMDKLTGSTVVLIDASGSMHSPLSRNSKTTRVDAASSLAAIAKEISEDVTVYSFNQKAKEIPQSFRGFALCKSIKAIGCTAAIDSTYYAIKRFRKFHNGRYPSRVIVITDEQTNADLRNSSFENLPKCCNGYLINVASYEEGIKHSTSSNWTTINGWSENILKYISVCEKEKKN